MLMLTLSLVSRPVKLARSKMQRMSARGSTRRKNFEARAKILWHRRALMVVMSCCTTWIDTASRQAGRLPSLVEETS